MSKTRSGITTDLELHQLVTAHKITASVQYRGTFEDYDGASELICECGKRFGRWTGKNLRSDEIERRYGRT